MATTKAKPKAGFTADVLEALKQMGETRELRFKLRQIKLSNGKYHKLTRPLIVRVKWSVAVQLLCGL